MTVSSVVGRGTEIHIDLPLDSALACAAAPVGQGS